MRVRVSFEWMAGACVWADDAEARERWCSAVELAELPVPPSLREQAEELQRRFDHGHELDGNTVRRLWTAEQLEQFHQDARAWRETLARAIESAGITVAEYGAPQEDAGAPIFEGSVMACFADEDAREIAARDEMASFEWRDTATWEGGSLMHRSDVTTPAELLARLETLPGFVCGWWQLREGGSDAMLEGDPVEHAAECVRIRNATGLANFLSWLRVERVHLAEELATAEWFPGKQHRLADPRGSWWEWLSFARNAASVVKGGKASDRYLRSERDRLFHKWAHGGSRAGWPATFGEALERIDLRREAFNRWQRPPAA